MKNLLFIFFIGTIAMIYVMVKTGSGLKNSITPSGIIDLEFAYNTTKTNTVINSWKQNDKINDAIKNTYWDFVFLFFYSGFLFFACKRIACFTKGPVAKAGNLFARGALLAGCFDVLENIGMLLTLHNSGSAVTAFFTTFFSVLKWILVTIAVLYTLCGITFWITKKWRSRL